MEWDDLDKGEISLFLKRYRKSKGITMEELEDDHLLASRISVIENGMEGVSKDKVQYYCAKFGFCIEDIPRMIEKEKMKDKAVELKLLSIENTIELVDPDEGLKKLQEFEIPSFDYDPLTAAKAKFIESKAYIKKSNWKRAQSKLNMLIRWINKKPNILDSTNLKAAAYHELSRISYFEDDIEQALKYNQIALRSYNETDQANTLRYILSISKVIYLNQLDEPAQALEELNKLWEYIGGINNAEIIINMYDLKAEISMKLKMYDEAIKSAKQGIILAKESKIIYRSCELWKTLGSIYIEIEAIEEAELCFLSALRLKDQIYLLGREYVHFSIYKELGKLYIQQEKWAEAEEVLKRAEKERNHSTPLKYNEILITLGESYLKQEKYLQAIQVLKKALAIAKEHKLKEQLKQITFKIALCWREQGEDYKFMNSLIDWFDVELEYR